ncbi:hypothetical protein JR316_0009902 [Psilocybe cubensis]|uniref:Uncharacterized protein n=2 Tax=Psilocybe cubensis TaxID=181762 RepID=A0ACB8GQ33_PSICU|nr:hypothetical protein JR316_0009902 [Psilocybe cubensis]KAH9477676.1 hypothetical protein JR316_0009902 [Psilocybe cubensis]
MVASLSPTSEVPQVIPGPGLPSLESLGLTSSDLHVDHLKRDLTARKAEMITCEDFEGSMVSAANAQACINYLNSIGTTSCGVPADSSDVIFCETADAYIWGTNLWGAGQAETASW